jgi:aldehyde dehydrogenase (NAD+)
MDCASLITRQRQHFQAGATRPLAYRQDQLRRLQAAIESRESALLDALHADLRKPPIEAYTAEIGYVLSDIRHAHKHLPAWMKPQRRSLPLMAWPGRAAVHPEPFGVALIIGPWNYPFQLLFSPLVGAIAAGNCVVLKPSEFAPHTAAVITKLITETFPAEYLTVVEGDRQVAEALLREKFDTIFFTGSTAVGRAVMTAAAQHLTPVALELGGKCPAIVCADTPLDVTARRLAWGKFMNAGQTCVVPDFVVADRRIREPLVDALRQTVREFYGDNPQQSPDYGRIINRRHFDRLSAFATGNADDLYIPPTILTDVTWDAPVMKDEIFGPILPVLEFDALDDALAKLRARPTPLALYLFTNDRATQERVVAGTRSGGVCINDTVVHIAGKDLPFGGLGESGMGRYHGKASFDCFSHQRSVVRRSVSFDTRHRCPPPKLPLAKLRRFYRFLLGD